MKLNVRSYSNSNMNGRGVSNFLNRSDMYDSTNSYNKNDYSID